MRRRANRALAVALLFLVGSAGQEWHRTVERHAICAEHGEIVDAGAVGTSASAENGAQSSVRAASPESSGHGHEHCAALLGTRERLSAKSIDALFTALETSDHAPLIATFAPSSRSALESAPKQSPPRA